MLERMGHGEVFQEEKEDRERPTQTCSGTPGAGGSWEGEVQQLRRGLERPWKGSPAVVLDVLLVLARGPRWRPSTSQNWPWTGPTTVCCCRDHLPVSQGLDCLMFQTLEIDV